MRELISLNVDVIVTPTSQVTRAAQNATQTTPIVMVSITDPVGQGLVQSLARPGGNITGNTDDTGLENAEKRLQLLKELLPAMSRVACLRERGSLQHEEGQAIEAAAAVLGVEILFAESLPNDLTGAFAFIARERPDALLITQTGSYFANRVLVVEFAAKRGLPTMYPKREFVNAGGLIAYGVEVADLFRRAAGHVDKILKGAKPGDLPVEQPTKFELVINLRAAKALGITVPSTLLLRADEVLE